MTAVADGTTRNQLAFTKMLVDFSLRDKPSLSEPMKDVNWRLVIQLAVIGQAAVVAAVARYSHVDAREAAFSCGPTIGLFCVRHRRTRRLQVRQCGSSGCFGSKHKVVTGWFTSD